MEGNQGGRGVPPTMAMPAASSPLPQTHVPPPPTAAPASVRPPPRSGGGAAGIVAAVVGIGCLGLLGIGAVIGVGALVFARTSSAASEPIVVGPVGTPPPIPAGGGPTVGIVDPYAAERMAVPIPAGAPSRGPLDAPITIVEAADFQCPFCARASATITRVLADHPSDVRLVWIDHPLPFHDHARPAARAAREAMAQGGDARFWVMHDLLFANSSSLDRATLLALGMQAGLDPYRLGAAVDGPGYDAGIDADAALAERFGARGTPGFFVNGRRVMGAQPYETFARMIDEELAHARRLEASGVPRAQIYATLTAHASPTAIPEPSRPTPAAADAREDPAAVHRVPVEGAPQQGPADALATIVVFSDFQCPFCSRLAPTLARVREQYGRDVRIVFRHNPLPFHQRALPAAIASSEVFAAAGSDAFFRMHDVLFENQRALEDEDLVRYAQQVGVDGGRVRAALARSAHQSEIEADQTLARSIGADGTPTCFVNGRILVGAQPFDAFARLVDEEIAHARAMIAAGTPRDRVYDVIMAGAH